MHNMHIPQHISFPKKNLNIKYYPYHITLRKYNPQLIYIELII